MAHPLDKHSNPKAPNVRSASMRKLGKDGNSFTPTEKRKKDKAMRQFSKQRKGYAVAISDAYRVGYDGIHWGDE